MPSSNSGPIDPSFIAFREGLAKAVKDSADRWGWRWHPRDNKWYVYSSTEWVLEDLGLPDTSPEEAVKKKSTWPTPTYEVQSFFLERLWERLRKAANSYSSRHPGVNLVWSPWGDGDWRSAFKRTPGVPPVRRNGDHVDVRLPARALEQVKEIEEWQRRGYISADQAQKMINEVIARNTPDA
jgi:hypothetical protein